jgi:broad specificity phosphatase PhoE
MSLLTPLRRRAFVASVVAATAWPAQARAAPGPVLLLRHAQTDAGIGDPPGFVLERCSTQRNLSVEGRTQARAIGARLAALALRPAAIRSSRWCRCLHTADEIALGLGAGAVAPAPWTALDSFFGQREREPAQTQQLRARLATLRGPGFEIWVTHQVNISAFVAASTAMGQALWVSRRMNGTLTATPFE